MGKEGGSSWISVLKKAIHAHIHGDIDEDIIRFPHLPHKKVQASPAASVGPPTTPSSSSSSGMRRTCSCSCGHVSSQGPQVDGSARSHESNSSGGSSSSMSLSDFRSSTGSCSMTCLSTTISKRIHPTGDRSLSPTEEPTLHYEDETDDCHSG